VKPVPTIGRVSTLCLVSNMGWIVTQSLSTYYDLIARLLTLV
jgi:hypothetical protein